MPTFGPPARFFRLLCSERTGEYLAAVAGDDGPTLSLVSRADDSTCWLPEVVVQDGGGLRLAHADVELTVSAEPCPSSLTAARPGEQGIALRLVSPLPPGLEESADVFTLRRGPAELPSQSLAHMRQHGYTVLPEIFHPDSIAEMKRTFDAMQEASPPEGPTERVGLMNIINSTPIAAQCAVHPVVLYLLESFVGGAIHFGHSPQCAVAKPQDGTLGNEYGGWVRAAAESPPPHPPSPTPFPL